MHERQGGSATTSFIALFRHNAFKRPKPNGESRMAIGTQPRRDYHPSQGSNGRTTEKAEVCCANNVTGSDSSFCNAFFSA